MESKVTKRYFSIALVLMVLALSSSALAQEGKKGEKPKGPPPALVVTAKVQKGAVAPQASFIGTLYFVEESDVAAEVAGLVEEVAVQEGDPVEKGQVLVRLTSDLLDKEIAAARAQLEAAKADHEFARLEYTRTEQLFRSETVHEGEYDSKRLTAKSLEAKVSAEQARLSRLLLERKKKTIKAPYEGEVLSRKVYRGEWVAAGAVVMELARVDEFDVVVNVPAAIHAQVSPGHEAIVETGGRKLDGRVHAAVLKGDVATRTFPVRIRVKNPGGLAEGMEARVRLATGDKVESLIVPRDAVISSMGKLVVFTVQEGAAQPVPVDVVGYEGLDAGIAGLGLEPGMDVVVKGNERLRPGQPVAPKSPQ